MSMYNVFIAALANHSEGGGRDCWLAMSYGMTKAKLDFALYPHAMRPYLMMALKRIRGRRGSLREQDCCLLQKPATARQQTFSLYPPITSPSAAYPPPETNPKRSRTLRSYLVTSSHVAESFRCTYYHHATELAVISLKCTGRSRVICILCSPLFQQSRTLYRRSRDQDLRVSLDGIAAQRAGGRRVSMTNTATELLLSRVLAGNADAIFAMRHSSQL